MPLLNGNIFKKCQEPSNLKNNDDIFYLEPTKEIFINYEDYLDRVILVNSFIWTCGFTGKTDLSYEEALESENIAKLSLKSIPVSLLKPILYAAYVYKADNFDKLLQLVLDAVHDRFFIGEEVYLYLSKSEEGFRAIIKNVLPPTERDKNIIISKLEYTCTVKNKVFVVTSDKLKREINFNALLIRGILISNCEQDINSLFVVKEEMVKKFKLDHCRWANFFLGLPQPLAQISTKILKKEKKLFKCVLSSFETNADNFSNIRLFKDEFGSFLFVLELFNLTHQYLEINHIFNLGSFVNVLLDTKLDGSFIILINKLFLKILFLDKSYMEESIFNSFKNSQLFNLKMINNSNVNFINTWTITTLLYAYINTKSSGDDNDFVNKQCYRFKRNDTTIFSILQNGHILELLPFDRLILIKLLYQILISFNAFREIFNSKSTDEDFKLFMNTRNNNLLPLLNINPLGVDSFNNKYWLLPSIDGLFFEYSINEINIADTSLENEFESKTSLNDSNNSWSEVSSFADKMVNSIDPEFFNENNNVFDQWAVICQENFLENLLEKLSDGNKLNQSLNDAILNSMDRILITMNNCDNSLLSMPHTINDLVINHWKLDQSLVSEDLPNFNKKMMNSITQNTQFVNTSMKYNDNIAGLSHKRESIIDCVRNEGAIIGFRDAALMKCVAVMREEMRRLLQQLTLNGLTQMSFEENQQWFGKLSSTKNMCFVEVFTILKEFLLKILGTIESKHLTFPLNCKVENFKNHLLDGVPSIPHLFLPLRIIGSSVNWHKSALNAKCDKCKLGAEQMDYLLLCDSCDSGLHLKCHVPPLDELPEESWICNKCVKKEVQDDVLISPADYINHPQVQFYDLPCDDVGDFSDVEVFRDQSEASPKTHPSANITTVTKTEDTAKTKKGRKTLDNTYKNAVMGNTIAANFNIDKNSSKKTTSKQTFTNPVTPPNKERKSGSGGKIKLDRKVSTNGKRNRRGKYAEAGVQDGDEGIVSLSEVSRSEDKTSLNERSRQLFAEPFYEDGDSVPKRKYSTPKTTFRSTAAFQKAVESLINDIMKNDNVWPFLTPVTAKVAPDYHEIVKQPMDLSKIKYKMYQMQYPSPNELIADVRLMFDNCFLYNPRGTVVRKAGENLEKYFEKRLAAIEGEEGCEMNGEGTGSSKKKKVPTATLR